MGRISKTLKIGFHTFAIIISIVFIVGCDSEHTSEVKIGSYVGTQQWNQGGNSWYFEMMITAINGSQVSGMVFPLASPEAVSFSGTRDENRLTFNLHVQELQATFHYQGTFSHDGRVQGSYRSEDITDSDGHFEAMRQ